MASVLFSQLYRAYIQAIRAIDTLDALNSWKQVDLRVSILQSEAIAEAQYRSLIRLVARGIIQGEAPDWKENKLVAELYEADLDEMGPHWEFSCYADEFATLKAQAIREGMVSEDN